MTRNAPMPADFPRLAAMYYDAQIARQYGIGVKVVARWRRECGVKAVHARKWHTKETAMRALAHRQRPPKPPEAHLSQRDRALLYAALRAFSGRRVEAVA